jgi:hypothetical protein
MEFVSTNCGCDGFGSSGSEMKKASAKAGFLNPVEIASLDQDGRLILVLPRIGLKINVRINVKINVKINETQAAGKIAFKPAMKDFTCRPMIVLVS